MVKENLYLPNTYTKIFLNRCWETNYYDLNEEDIKLLSKCEAEYSQKVKRNTTYFFGFNFIIWSLLSLQIALANVQISSFTDILYLPKLLLVTIVIFLMFWIGYGVIYVFCIPNQPLGTNTLSREKIQSFEASLSKKIITFFYHSKPFSFQFVWSWILIIGIASAITEYIPNQSKLDAFNMMLISIGRSLLITILAFIAANIIRELLSLRDDYGKSATDFAKIKNELTKASSQVQDLRTTLELKEIDDKYENFIGHLSKEKDSFHILDQAKNEFKNSLKSLFESFDNKLTENAFADFWLLSGLANDIKISSELFKDENLIVTKFEIFAEILKNSLQPLISAKRKKSNLNFEIFTTVVIPPDRFFNYSLKKEEQEKWQEYLVINKIATQNGILQHRHFISFADSVSSLRYNEKHFVRDSNDEDIKPLVKTSFKEKLSKYLEYEEDGSLRTENEIWYKVCSEDTGNCKKLPDAIQDYHCIDCAKVMEINLTNENIESFFHILIDKKTLKPIDYYAIKQNGDWVFCFKAVYDNSYNTAALWLYNSKSSQWNNITNELNTLFSNHSIDDMEIDVKQKNKLKAVRKGVTITTITDY